jgi:hypothetical protein
MMLKFKSIIFLIIFFILIIAKSVSAKLIVVDQRAPGQICTFSSDDNSTTIQGGVKNQ